MVTAAMLRGFRSRVPAKMTSSMRVPRRVLADCSPRTQLMASLRLDFPQPLGPTTAAMPEPGNFISVLSKKDLKPWISTRFSFSKVQPLPNHYLSGGPYYVNREGWESKAGGRRYLVGRFGRVLYVGYQRHALYRRHPLPYGRGSVAR